MKAVLSMALGVFLSAGLIGQEFRLGSQVTDFTVSKLNGKPVNFSSLAGDTTVMMFVSTQCPVSNAYNDRMTAVYNEYAPKGVKFVVINSNGTEPADEVRLHAATQSFPFAVYKDVDNTVADRFGAQVTPETFVVGKSGEILYHGAIDDSQNPANVKTQGLRMALDAVLSGQSVARAETKAFGCGIKRVKRAS
jgi:thiol-disulfide isomerase/thioredoxin